MFNILEMLKMQFMQEMVMIMTVIDYVLNSHEEMVHIEAVVVVIVEEVLVEVVEELEDHLLDAHNIEYLLLVSIYINLFYIKNTH